jgi:hypothetical protein
MEDQIVFWASLTLPELREPREMRRFPVSFDTGFNNGLCIPERYLSEWAGLTTQDLAWVGDVRFQGRLIPLHDAAIWIHPNRPGSRDTLAGRPAYRLHLPRGIMVWPRAMGVVRRLPLLGLYAIRDAGLLVSINGWRRRVGLRTPWRFWPFG